MKIPLKLLRKLITRGILTASLINPLAGYAQATHQANEKKEIPAPTNNHFDINDVKEYLWIPTGIEGEYFIVERSQYKERPFEEIPKLERLLQEETERIRDSLAYSKMQPEIDERLLEERFYQPPQPSKFRRGLNGVVEGGIRGVLFIPVVPQIPSTVIHEGCHALMFKIFGVGIEKFRPFESIKILTSPNFQDVSPKMGYVEPNWAEYNLKMKNSKWKDSAMRIAPYILGDLLIKHRLIELAFAKGKTNNQWVGLPLAYTAYMDMYSPLANAITNDGDITQFSKRLHLNRKLVACTLTAVYLYSGYRIIKAAEKGMQIGYSKSF